jgi:5-methyltetrahydrofolate--homocysteine methyltransferase
MPRTLASTRGFFMESYLASLKGRVLIFDGAMGTSIQALDLSEDDFGGTALAGCNDHLVFSRPDVIRDIHHSFLSVGCDVVETDTFRANRLSLREYGLETRVVDLNRKAALLAREAVDSFSTPDRPRFVAGSMGPTGFLPSSSDPALGNVSYGELLDVYREQARGLLEGGVDVLLIETGQDLLEMKAAVSGCRRAFLETGREVPIQTQVTLDTAGRMLLGTDISAALVVLETLRVSVVGLNCSTGPEPMREPIRYLSEHTGLPISVIPNAGIPYNQGGEAVYPLTPEALADAHEEFVRDFGVSIVGGCCGTTPEHIREVVDRVSGSKPSRRSPQSVPRCSSAMSSRDLRQVPAPTLIGERVNTQGSREVKERLLEDDYEGVVQIARAQVEGGAHFLDVCVALTERSEEAQQMRALVKLLAQSVDAPLWIDSTEPEVIRAGLEQFPGRGVVNSIHLEDGTARLKETIPIAREHGAAVVALTIDEEGMARTAERKLRIAQRIHHLCVGDHGLRSEDLIIDPLTFTLATGDPEYQDSAVETLEALQRIRSDLPGVHTSLGVSNVSFGLQPQARAVLNSVFLHHCVEAGLTMAIVNPVHIQPYPDIEREQRALADDLIFRRRGDALDRFIAYFQERTVHPTVTRDPAAEMEPAQAIHWKILHRSRDGIEALVDETVARRGGGDAGAVETLNQVLLPAMKEVGDRFGAGELILPFVLQSAEVMKRAVARLETYMDRKEGESKGTLILATVFGDVHDIGKNLVHTILSNNGYTVHDLGKQVPVNTIIQRAQEVDADAIGLSALLVSTSKQMPLCVKELHHRGLEIPVLVGGAAINPTFARNAALLGEKELYGPGVYYCKDAFDGLAVMDALTDPESRDAFQKRWAVEVEERSAERRALQARAQADRASGPISGPRRPKPDVAPPEPRSWGVRVLDRIPVQELVPLMDLNTLYRLHWGAKNAKGERYRNLIREEYEPRLDRYAREAEGSPDYRVRGAYGIFPAASQDDTLWVFDPDDREKRLARFSFPRQKGRDRLCLADYFRPLAPPSDGEAPPGPADVAAFQIVAVGEGILSRTSDLMNEGEYSEGYFRHGFAVRLAEAAAEYVHRRIRKELGIEAERGLRYSWGYGACPDPLQHRELFRLLPARERLGLELTDAGVLVPELSTAALVVHHPEARYFSA